MKILVVQLARFGDIYQTWPVLRALRRQNPEANIQVLVRSRFAEATIGLNEINGVIELPTSDWLSTDIDGALNSIDRWFTENDLTGCDRVINLSFSPLSSYVVDLIGCPDVVGYTRQSDGYLAIPDEPSAYFYAQVGFDRSNRIHLDDIFAMIAGVELSDQDFYVDDFRAADRARSGVVIQVGASQDSKTLGRETWVQIIQQLLDQSTETITLVGADGEWDDSLIKHPRLINRVGQTRLRDLFDIIGSAHVFVGCDSVGLHIATLTQTPTLNISFAAVRFWETGPRATGSRVLWFDTADVCDVSRVCDEALRMVGGAPLKAPIIVKAEASGVIYDLIGYDEETFSWDLVRALYAHADRTSSVAERCQHARISAERAHITRLALERVLELASLALQQIDVIETAPNAAAIQILDQVDILLEQVSRLAHEISPLIRWFQTEKLRIAPGALNDILRATRVHFVELREIARAALLNLQLGRDTNAQFKEV